MAEIEICCGDVESLMAAAWGGARRIELCCGLSDGGLTPSPATIRKARQLGIEKINVLIRVRGGDFLYSDDEKEIMLEEAREAFANGATGIVVGALLPDGKIDKSFCRDMAAIAAGRDMTFHRAFDMCSDWPTALEEIIGMGFTSLLTSGLASDAFSGMQTLKEIKQRAADRITVMAGSGINSVNCREILDKTGVDAIHGTARRKKGSGMLFRRGDVSMGARDADEYERSVTDAEEVRAIIRKCGD